jgi:hypothetical protein
LKLIRFLVVEDGDSVFRRAQIVREIGEVVPVPEIIVESGMEEKIADREERAQNQEIFQKSVQSLPPDEPTTGDYYIMRPLIVGIATFLEAQIARLANNKVAASRGDWGVAREAAIHGAMSDPGSNHQPSLRFISLSFLLDGRPMHNGANFTVKVQEAESPHVRLDVYQGIAPGLAQGILDRSFISSVEAQREDKEPTDG